MLVRVVRNSLCVAVAGVALLAATSGQLIAQRSSNDAAAERQRGRQDLEQELARRLALIAKAHLKLSDAQFARLQSVNAQFAERRTELMRRERSARFELRRQMRQGDTANDAAIERSLGEMLSAQRDRVTLLAQEQEALAAFLSPMQRARYLGLQEGFRREVEERREGNSDARSQRRGPPGNG